MTVATRLTHARRVADVTGAGHSVRCFAQNSVERRHDACQRVTRFCSGVG